MDAKVRDPTGASNGFDFDETFACSFPLGKLKVGEPDKLHHIVLDILWCGSDYAVYRSERGIYVHFSDCPERERKQREAFTQIAPELCELRVFTSQFQSSQNSTKRPSWFGFRTNDGELFDHNIAQSVMLTMEDKLEDAKEIARAALAMAVRRATNDNTIRYVFSCMLSAAVWIILLVALMAYKWDNLPLFTYCTASIFGALGATFSIITRVEAFEMRPCQQSNMNYLMSFIRVSIGIIGGAILFLFGHTIVSGSVMNGEITKLLMSGQWEIPAAFGFIGGFSERLIQSVLRRTADAIASTSGTPVQEARRWESTSRR